MRDEQNQLSVLRKKQTYMEPSTTISRTPPASNYEKLRQTCLEAGSLYEDPDFGADDASIYFRASPPYTLKWMRPQDIAQEHGLPPTFFRDGGSRFDLKQGELGTVSTYMSYRDIQRDCWVLAAAASVCDFNRDIFEWLVPHDQGFDEASSYAGIFRFRFWHYGTWTEVCVDDRLPTYDSRLVFVHSNHPNEFWGALLEKAYAKLHGTYEAIKGGSNADSLTDFTGGLVESYEMQDVPHDLPRLLTKAFARKSVIAASIYGDYENNPVGPNGLVMGHAYSVTGFATVNDVDGVKKMLIRIRNPWGTKTEWNGPWGDRSKEWENLTASERNSLELQIKDDGEFWMSLSDFVRNISSLQICNLTPDSLREVPKAWTISVKHNTWKAGSTAGGRPSNGNSFHKNTQYHLTLEDHDEDDDKLGSMVIELMQKDRRSNAHLGYDNLVIGFVVFRVPAGTRLPLSPEDLYDGDLLVGTSGEYVNLRSVVRRFAFAPGDYVIVATTYEPNEEADYMLRVFTEAAHHMVQ